MERPTEWPIQDLWEALAMYLIKGPDDWLIRNDKNLGYAKAVNQGLKLASDSLVAIVNNDTIISPNWQEVAKEVLSDSKTYSCHPRMINYTDEFKYGNKTV